MALQLQPMGSRTHSSTFVANWTSGPLAHPARHSGPKQTMTLASKPSPTAAKVAGCPRITLSSATLLLRNPHVRWVSQLQNSKKHCKGLTSLPCSGQLLQEKLWHVSYQSFWNLLDAFGNNTNKPNLTSGIFSQNTSVATKLHLQAAWGTFNNLYLFSKFTVVKEIFSCFVSWDPSSDPGFHLCNLPQLHISINSCKIGI